MPPWVILLRLGLVVVRMVRGTPSKASGAVSSAPRNPELEEQARASRKWAIKGVVVILSCSILALIPIYFLNRSNSVATPQTTGPSPPAPAPLASLRNLDDKEFGEYTIRIYRDDNDVKSAGLFEILKHGARVYTEKAASFEIDDSETPIGTDIIGTGIPAVVVKRFSGGTSCCTSFEIFELGSNFRQAATIDQGRCDAAGFERTDDHRYIFRGCDPAATMVGSSSADLATPRVILRYENGLYHLAYELMRKPAPSMEELRAKAAEIVSNPVWATEGTPSQFWQFIIDLLYSGNARSTDQFVALAWPSQRNDREQIMQEHLSQLKKSPYWADIQALNAQ